MPAFRQISPYQGVDEKMLVDNSVGVIVPLGGDNVVILADGLALKVTSTLAPSVQVEELTEPLSHPIWSMLVSTGLTIANLKAGSIRVFKIKGHAVAGLDKVKVHATNPRTAKIEATLKITVLRRKVLKVSIRPTLCLDERKNRVNFNAPVDPQKLLDRMNAVWEPQANVSFQLASTNPVLIDGLSLVSRVANIKNPALLKSFTDNKDPAADLTMFMVRQALDGKDVVNGVTNALAAIALISDNRSENTMAHEAGHFLGTLNDHGKPVGDYGHHGTDADLLMRDGGAGQKIPFGLVTDFNKGYRSK